MPYYVMLQVVKNIKETTMKKLLVTGAAIALSILPVASVSADTGTNISGSQNEGYSTDANKSSNNSSSSETYVNQTVSYEELYYVKYGATLTAYTKDTQSAADHASLSQNYFNNNDIRLSIPAYTANYQAY